MVLGRSSRYTSGVQDDLGLEELETSKGANNEKKVKFSHDGIQTIRPSPGKSEKEFDKANAKSLKAKVLSRVFSEDFEREKKKIAKFVLDPRGKAIRLWNKILRVVCIVALFVDPIFLYLPITDLTNACVEIAMGLQRVIMILRSVMDAFYFIQIIVRFHTAYVAPSSRVFGRGELVINHKKIFVRYLKGEFWIHLLAAIPIPQIMIWLVIPKINGSVVLNTRNVLRFFVTPQYILRLYLIFPLSKQIVRATGVMTRTASLGAAFNVMLFLVASHVLGGCWYIFGIERIEACWKSVCYGNSTCELNYFDCGSVGDAIREAWITESNVTVLCNPSNSISNYPFGIYSTVASNTVPALNFWAKVSYCFWWGLQQLCCLGQNLIPSTYIGENIFNLILAAVGLILFSLIFGDLQRYVLSTSKRLEQWRLKRTDTELWMRHRQLPPELKESVQKFDRYKWVTTRGIDEEALLKALPSEIRRDIKRHLCLDLVRRVPMFHQMDDRTLDAVCERLKPALRTEGMVLVREGDPVSEMLFIIRGHLDSYTTESSLAGITDSCRLRPGDFCCDELLTWALDPRTTASDHLPLSTRTVMAVTEVEAFALCADDLKFVASQFRRLHSQKVKLTFRFYSPQWRTWAARYIQAAWRRYKKHRDANKPGTNDPLLRSGVHVPLPGSGLAIYSMKFSANMTTSARKDSGPAPLVKPARPDFDDILVPPPGSSFATYAMRLTASIRRDASKSSNSGLSSPFSKPAESNSCQIEE